MIKKQLIYVLALILVVLQLFFKPSQLPKISLVPTCTGQACLTPTINVSDKQTVKVVWVIDGDTIEIEGKIKVRYIGINTPEIYHDTTGKKTGEQCFADEAYLENKELVEGKIVVLMKDISDKDKYGRLLRYVYVGDQFVNEYLIKNGFAKIMTVKPDIKFYLDFKESEKTAKENKLGIWNKCK